MPGQEYTKAKVTKENWSELKALADNALRVPLDLHFTNQQMQSIQQGFIPLAMVHIELDVTERMAFFPVIVDSG